MFWKSIWVTIIAAIVFFVSGFVLANFLNRNELNALRGENERLKTAQTDAAKSNAEVTLSDEEIADKLAEAERNPSNFAFQKSLGLGLYRYGAIKKDKDIIEKAIRVLERAYTVNANDYDLIVSLGHAHYDVGYFGKNNASFERSREFYNKALAKRSDDVDIRTDLGMTYFLQDPPDYGAAFGEFERSLAINPKHEKTLAFAALALKNQNKDFSKLTATLRIVNPNNPTLRELEGPGTESPPQQQ